MDQLLIVGGGLAGSLLAAESYTRGIPFSWLINPDLPGASSAAYGICNPIHFRNKLVAWNAENLYPVSSSFFQGWQEMVNTDFFRPIKVLHLVSQESELIQWRQHYETTPIWKFTDAEPVRNELHHFKDGFGAAIIVNEAFNVSIPAFVTSVMEKVKAQIIYTKDDFFPEKTETGWKVNDRHYRFILLSRGIYESSMPFFRAIPFNPCKGEVLEIRIPGLTIDYAVHKKIFLLPLGSEVFACGATYEWQDLGFSITEKGKEEILDGLRELIGNKYDFSVVSHRAGVRPAISDRRPVVGMHPRYPGLGILNGFGSRGLMVGPAAAKNLLDHLYNNDQILKDWDVNRFKRRLLNPQFC